MCRFDEENLFTRRKAFDFTKENLGIPKKAKLYRKVFHLFFPETDFMGRYVSIFDDPYEDIPKVCFENSWPKKIRCYFKMKSKGRPEAKLIGENIFKEMKNAVYKHSNLLILNQTV